MKDLGIKVSANAPLPPPPPPNLENYQVSGKWTDFVATFVENNA